MGVVVQLPDVLLEVKVAAESLAADGTLEGFLVVVCVHVEGEVVHLVERLVTHVTLVRLLARVGEFVVLVVALLVEAFPAELTHERLVPLVDPDVRVQRRRPVNTQHLVTHLYHSLSTHNTLLHTCTTACHHTTPCYSAHTCTTACHCNPHSGP